MRESQLEYLVEQTRRRAQAAEDKMLSMQLDLQRQARPLTAIFSVLVFDGAASFLPKQLAVQLVQRAVQRLGVIGTKETNEK